MKKVIIFLLLWLAWGFSLGTILLLGPLRWIVDFERKESISALIENVTVIGIIIFLCVVTFLIARISLTRIYNTTTNSLVKRGLVLVPLIGLGICIFIFMHPSWVYGKNSSDEVINNNFTVGSYPEKEQLEKLKDEGYDGVISLLHPAVVPFEPALLDKEKNNAREVGIELVSIPMLPWISENEASIDSLRKFVAKPRGKYYLHCYLGRDRVQAAAKIISQVDKNILDKQFEPGTDLSEVKLERGQLVKLEEGVYLSPFPTKEEYFHLIPGLSQVVSLVDLSDEEAKANNELEKQWLKPYTVDLQSFQVNETTSPGQMQKIIAEVKKMKKPLLIHGFFSDSKEVLLFKDLYNKTPRNGGR